MLFSILYSWSLQHRTNESIGIMILQRFYKSYFNVGVLETWNLFLTLSIYIDYWITIVEVGSMKLYHIEIVLIKPLFDKIVSIIYRIIQTISFMSP